MKKLFALLLALLMVFAFAACGVDDDDDDDDRKKKDDSSDYIEEDENGGDNEFDYDFDFGGGSESNSAEQDIANSYNAEKKVADYINENKAELLESFESSFASSASGLTCTSSLSVSGRGFTISVNINELSNLSADMKQTLQETYDTMDSTFESLLDQMQLELPELEYFTIKVCDKYGDVLATIKAGD